VTDLVDDVAAFGARLRAEGVRVDAASLIAYARGCGMTSPADAYWVGRATLLTAHDDIVRYDRAFAAHYGPDPGSACDDDRRPETPPGAAHPVFADPELGGEGADEDAHTPASDIERLRAARFEDCSDEELRQIEALAAHIRWTLPARLTRRRQAARRGRPDVARTLRRELRTNGDAWEFERRERRWRRRPLVLVLDVSGSMAAYSRVLLSFAYGALTADETWEAFCFGTRLTRLTPALRRGGADAALAAAAAEVDDWHGGTRIGASLRTLLERWGPTNVVRGAIVVVCSDGLEIGDPTLLGSEMARLARTAREVVWLNPLKGLAGYQPLARGMTAALAHIDVFASGDTLNSLEDMAVRLASVTRPTARRP
jgi:uncharacterized protein with von Willebrand factor type A (vWA) domain